MPIRRVLGDSSVINQSPDSRRDLDESTLGFLIADYIAGDKNLSRDQEELSALKLGRFPRVVRGVAGSGKTVVLANQVARYALRNGDLFEQGDSTIAALCFNRALVPFLRDKIRTSYVARSVDREPPDQARVNHLNGLMYYIARELGVYPIEYIPISGPNGVTDAVQRANTYRAQVEAFAKEHPDWYRGILFDAFFVDEGQDFEPEEYKLLLDLLKPDPDTGEKCLIIFYDDAQNLYAKRRPNWKEDVGIDVGKGDRSRVMKECFRNTREIVELAFNVLVGTQAPDDQKVRTRTFAHVNELAKQGSIEEGGDLVHVKFAERTFEMPAVRGFQERADEKQWIAGEILRLITQERVKPEHILVLFHKSEEFADLDRVIRSKDVTGQIKGFMKPHYENKDEYIFKEHHLTLSTTFSAKGYDAYVVFIAGADLFDIDESGRASFYVGATRARLILNVSGLDRTRTLFQEALKICELLQKSAIQVPE